MDDITEPEQQLVELMRKDRSLSLTITEQGGLWEVHLENHTSGKVSEGRADDFATAWDHLRRLDLVLR